MKILFLGGKNVGCGCLEYLLERKKDLVGIIVNPSDIDRDRWYKSAAEIGFRNSIPVFSLKNINSRESVSFIKQLSPDIIFVVYYDQLLKSDIINIPPMGCINLHLALAEEYRGCYPTTWAIIKGEKRTGVTLHYIDQGIDSGDIIAQREVPISEDDTGRTLYEKCSSAGIELFRNQMPLILSGKSSRRKQIATVDTKYFKREFPSREIDFSKSGKEIYDHIRALLFDPFPPPFFTIGGKKYTIEQETE
jgi:methionyl-tRNA formyltransferase